MLMFQNSSQTSLLVSQSERVIRLLCEGTFNLNQGPEYDHLYNFKISSYLADDVKSPDSNVLSMTKHLKRFQD